VCAPVEAPISVTVTPVALDASAAVTSMQASTLVISFALGDGEEATFDEELGDPHELTTRPQVATIAIRPLADIVLATAPVRVILGPVVSQAGNAKSSRSGPPAGAAPKGRRPRSTTSPWGRPGRSLPARWPYRM